ncbi:hypothetical protein L1267_20350 [Pseudoalteromonas sp. OFAV1]|jgi:predicted metal-dependent peptidase|uniref:vWA domain-containing protein n=1 Tax=Pseudoalteromonas sp. OFAV1 TaxID=2908892 RepID=UPI001F2239AC|nr:hypothetical protein [Pseudoalteromonas sp. OFAV1]MCF2902725.1 hypothetical protein [Pseudoalteromonas sp. OFAV1]
MENENLSNEQLKKVQDQIAIARVLMRDESPFFGIIAQDLQMIPAPQHMQHIVRTLAVTPTGLCMYNPSYVHQLDFEEVCGVLAHEGLHPALDFFGRFQGRDLDTANRAHDYAINLVIKDEGGKLFKLPKGVLLNEKFRNLSAEEIYFILEEDKQKKQKGNPQDGQQGNPQDSQQGGQQGNPQDNQQGGQQGNPQDNQQGGQQGNPQDSQQDGQQSDLTPQGNEYNLEGDINQDIIDAIEREFYGESGNRPTENELREKRENAKARWRDTLEQAYVENNRSGKGNLPSWMVTEIEGILNPKLSFKKMLQRFFGKFGAKTRRTYAKPNRRNLFQPNMFPLPGKRGSQPSLYLLLDTSGSMWDPEGFDLVKGALGIIKNLVNNGGYRVRIIMCDTEVKEDLDFDQVQKVIAQKNLKALGGGGSDFRDAFDYIWKDALYNNNAQAPIICITDGYIDVPEKQAKMRTSTAWVTPKGVKPPTTKWGDHMEMIL